MLKETGLKNVVATLIVLTIIIALGVHFAIQYLFGINTPEYRILGYATPVGSLLTGIAFSRLVSRSIWQAWRYFDESVYPDLSGKWSGSITFHGTDGSLNLSARIRHTPFSLQIDFDTDTAQSTTLSATARIDEGQHHLYYVYRATSRAPQRPSYLGTAHLRVQENSGALELSGIYYTERNSHGRILLRPQMVQPPSVRQSAPSEAPTAGGSPEPAASETGLR